MVAEDEEVDKVGDQLAEDDGELVPRHQHTTDAARCYLTDIHRADGRGQTHTDTADDAVDVEHYEQRQGRLALRQHHRLGIHRTPRRHEEHHTGEYQRALATPTRGQHTGDGRADDAADERTRTREAVPKVGVRKVFGSHEEGLQTLLRTGNHCRVVTEQQAAQYGHHHNRNQIGHAARLLSFHSLSCCFFVNE